MKRKTNQRSAIQEVFGKTDRPLAISEILETGRETVQSLNEATVYRNMKLLVENGWLKKVNSPELGTRYERAGKEHHHHFQCRSCDRLFEISGCAFNEDNSTPPGFVTESHEVYLFGICSNCNE
jgi:Fur family transcriptional regulator, ferric uptake regulator